MASRVNNAVETQDSTEVVREVPEFLIRNANFQFTEQETAMEQHRYHGYRIHCREHQDLTGKALQFQKEVATIRTNTQLEFTNLLKKSVLSHILMEGRRYGPYPNQRGVY